jgi:PAS domain S-box-containing protein
LFSVTDITEQTEAQRELEKREAELNDLVNFVNSAIVRWKPYGEITFFNRFAEEFFGYSADEVVGKSVTILLPEKESSGRSLTSLIDDVMSHPDRYESHVNENVRKNGDRVWMVWTNKPIFDDKGRLVEILAVGNDITTQKGDEQRLRESRDELEKVVLERTVELADMNSALEDEIEERISLEKALFEKAAELERSNRDLEEFAYVASHDLQEPLRNVTNCVQLLRRRYRDKLGEDADQLMAYAEHSAQGMKDFIDDLLQYSRIQARGKPFRTVDCQEVLSAAVENLRTVITEAHAVVTFDAMPTVKGDKTQLMQVFQNLIANSIKFRGDDPPRIHVSARQREEDWLFSVSDNGIGINLEYESLIFAPFKRLHGREAYPGSGIGLSVAKKILQRHQGTIWVESQPEAGSTFFFTIPVAYERHETSTASLPAGEAGGNQENQRSER